PQRVAGEIAVRAAEQRAYLVPHVRGYRRQRRHATKFVVDGLEPVPRGLQVLARTGTTTAKKAFAHLSTLTSVDNSVDPAVLEDVDPEVVKRIRHSCAHVLAQAVVERFTPDGDVQIGIGPPTSDGFYYDFGLPR